MPKVFTSQVRMRKCFECFYGLRLCISTQVVWLTILCSATGFARESETSKLPQPSRAEFDAKQREIRELFRDRFGKSSAETRQAFARELLRIGRDTKDDAVGRFVLVFEASIEAARSGDVALALEATQHLDRHYDIDHLAFKLQVLKAATRPGKDPTVYEQAAEAALQVYFDALAAGRMKTARAACQTANGAAKQGSDQPLIKAAKNALQALPHMEELSTGAEDAAKTVSTNPTDPLANELLGKYFCFVRDDWDAGIQTLVFSENAKLKELAELDLAPPEDAQRLLKLGDLWWDFSADDKGTTQSQYRRRAVYWYEIARRELSGLNRTHAEQRIAEAKENGIYPRPIDLLQEVDAQQDAIVGTWEKANGVLVVPEEYFARLGIRYAPPTEYILQVTLTPEPVRRGDGAGGFVIGLGSSEFQAHAVFDVPTTTGARSSLENIHGEGEYEDFGGTLLVPEIAHVITCFVRHNSITIDVDDTTVVTWHGNVSNLRPNDGWTTSNRVFSVGGHARRFHITAIHLIPLAGRGSVVH